MNEEEMKQILLNHCEECHLREYTSCVECEEKFAKATNKALNLIDKLQADKNKLINYIAVRENKTHEEVCKEFELGE